MAKTEMPDASWRLLEVVTRFPSSRSGYVTGYINASAIWLFGEMKLFRAAQVNRTAPQSKSRKQWLWLSGHATIDRG
jgi:hypothetical protein